MTDQELIEGLRRQDRTAFSYLVDHYQQHVIKTAFYFLGNMEDAEDLSQEIFVDVIRAVNSFRGDSSLKTWLYRITVNRSLNMLRKQKRSSIVVRLEQLFGRENRFNQEPVAEPVTGSDELERKERAEMLHAAIARLPENQRIAFVLHKFDGQPYKEIATIMNIRLPAVESLIFRARQNLVKYLKTAMSDH